MKTIAALLISTFLTLSGIAQTTNTVTIIFRGINKATNNYQLSIDGTSYYSNTNTQNVPNYRIIVNTLSPGRHLLKLYRLKNKSVSYNGKLQNTLVYTKNFELREGFDMNITVLATGRVQFSEAEVPVITSGSSSTSPMVTAEFNTLLQNVRNQSSQSARGESIRDAFVNNNNYFTTYQIRQLLVMITSESDRLDLAKMAYRNVTDPASYRQLASLFNSTAKRQEFNTYLGEVQATGNTTSTSSNPYKTQMADYQFNQLLQSVRDKWSQSLKGDVIHDAFVNTNNYFSTSQIRQLLTLITSESDRLDLVKLAYRGVTDANNFSSLADLFTTSANRAEFNNYVYANSNGSQVVNTNKTQISDYQFSQLVQSVRDKWSQSLKGETIRDAFANTNNYFSTSQIRQLLTMITSESDRLELVKLAYRGVTDAMNFGSLADLFSISSNRTEFNNYVYTQQGGTGNNSSATSAHTPMANGDFELLVLGVRSNLIQPLKINAVANIFNNPNYYFTTSQVRTLISLINSETSRLDLAKMSYRTVTDRNNFTQIYDLFTTQANKDSLADYVRTYQGQ